MCSASGKVIVAYLGDVRIILYRPEVYVVPERSGMGETPKLWARLLYRVTA